MEHQNHKPIKSFTKPQKMKRKRAMKPKRDKEMDRMRGMMSPGKGMMYG